MAVGVVSGPVPPTAAIIPTRAVRSVIRNASNPSGVSGIYAWLKYPLLITSMIVRSEMLLAANPHAEIRLRHFGAG
jgi:hypothetical protein